VDPAGFEDEDRRSDYVNLGHETYQGDSQAQFRSGACVGQLDPVVFVSAMASVSKSVCFGITGSTSYINVSTKPHSVSSPTMLKESSRLSLQEPGRHLTMQPKAVSHGMWSRVTATRPQKQMDLILLLLMISGMKKHMSLWI
jgi:hypothetical protein